MVLGCQLPVTLSLLAQLMMFPLFDGKSTALDHGSPPILPHGMQDVRSAALPRMPPRLPQRPVFRVWLVHIRYQLARNLRLHARPVLLENFQQRITPCVSMRALLEITSTD